MSQKISSKNCIFDVGDQVEELKTPTQPKTQRERPLTIGGYSPTIHRLEEAQCKPAGSDLLKMGVY